MAEKQDVLEAMREGMRHIGQDIDHAARYKDMMVKAGYTVIVERVDEWPISPWPKNPRSKKLGLWERHNFSEGLPAFSLAIFTRILGFTMEELQSLMD